MAEKAGGMTTAAMNSKTTPKTATVVATPQPRKSGDLACRGSSISPVESKTPDPAASLSARQGGMVLMDKEADGLIFEDQEIPIPKASRWSVGGKVCSVRPMKMFVLEKMMPRAWGLHKEARFRDMGSNIFVVHLGSEGDWRHVLNNGPWQFDFSVLIMKEYEGNIRPSEMVFENIDIWVRVSDLPPDKRCEAFGTALGNWIGKVVKVDTDGVGIARG